MWDVTGADETGAAHRLAFREFTGDELQRIIESPVRTGGSLLGWPAHLSDQLEKAIPTWLRPEETAAEAGPLFSAHPIRSTSNIVPILGGVDVRFPSVGGDGSEPAATVWIDESIVLIDKPGEVRELTFRYISEPADYQRGAVIESEDGRLAESHLEWYVAMGSDTGVAVGDVAFEGAGRAKTARVRVAEGAGRMVGRVVNILIKRSTRETRDPWQLDRLRELEQRQPAIATSIPALTDSLVELWNEEGIKRVNQGNRESAFELTVLVHGTMSSGMRMAAALFGDQPLPPDVTRVVRFEHDTFHTIPSNAADLAQLIGNLTWRVVAPDPYSVGRLERVLFICHSRGGLVAVEAAKLLTARTRDERMIGQVPIGIARDSVEVLTYGTPHAGTPLVSAADSAASLVRGFLTIASKMAANHFGVSPAAWGFGFALKLVRVPNGIRVMDPSDTYIKNRQAEAFNFDVTGWGARMNATSSGIFPAFKRGFLTELMQEPSDGVVPTRSALAGQIHQGEILDNVDHSGYFEHPSIRADIINRIQRGYP